MNVSALQQVHSYFINIFHRIYDRMTVVDAFAVSCDLLDQGYIDRVRIFYDG